MFAMWDEDHEQGATEANLAEWYHDLTGADESKCARVARFLMQVAEGRED